jgi:hypothetical protein
MATQSSLLVLPRELRNHIYTEVLVDRGTVLLKHDNELDQWSDIMLTCKQIHDEYLEHSLTAVFTSSSISIRSTVTDLNFSPITDFITSVPEGLRYGLIQPGKIEISVVITNPDILQDHESAAISWSNFCEAHCLKPHHMLNEDLSWRGPGYHGKVLRQWMLKSRLSEKEVLSDLANVLTSFSQVTLRAQLEFLKGRLQAMKNEAAC